MDERTTRARWARRQLAYGPFWFLLAVLVAGCGAREVATAAATVALSAPTPTVATTPRPPATTIPPTATTPPPTPTIVVTIPPTLAARPSVVPNRAAATGMPAANVRIVNFAFVPAALTVRAGTAVVWELAEGYHTVLSDDRQIDSPILENAGDRYTYTPTRPGTYQYVCGIHPDMVATLTVVP